jgi:single-stranded-DNA-specific exonuclease
MSLETAAATVAEQIRRQEFVEVFAHHDADGIAAASIICHAMLRSGVRFRLRVRHDVKASDLKGDAAYLLCDLGSGMSDLPKATMVVDHHLVKFEGEYHANPRLAGVNGDHELSAAGMAYYVAQAMGDNRDLAGLVIPGVLGDGQEFRGPNLEIFNDAIANGIIVPDRGILLPGRDMTERWYMATGPYLDGVSGNEGLIEEVLAAAHDPKVSGNGPRMDILLSQVVIASAKGTRAQSIRSVYGDTLHLQREVIEDAHALTAVIDACGKTGNGDIAATLCLRSSHDIDKAWEIARQHRVQVIEALKAARPLADTPGIFEVQGTALASDIADIMVRDLAHTGPVLVYAQGTDACHISARCPAGTNAEIGPLMHRLAESCGGNGGGHNHRAGATIPCDRIGAFAKGWQEAVVS